MIDWLRVSLIVGLIAAIVLLICLAVIGSANSSSRNISLAIGTVVAAFLLLLTQLWFELQPPTGRKSIYKTKYTVDSSTPRIEQYRYPIANAQRAIADNEANKFLLATNPAAYKGDPEKLWRDISLLAIVQYFWTQQHDWQVARDSFTDMEQYRFLSNREEKSECSAITLSEIQSRLRESGNLFADFKLVGMPFDYMCLPPGTSMLITENTFGIENNFCRITFDADKQWWSMDFNKPFSDERPLAPDGQNRYHTRTGVIRASVEYFALRSQSRQMAKYQEWANDVLDRAVRWFDSDIAPGSNYLKSGFEP